MNIDQIKSDLNEQGYAVVPSLLDQDQLENVRIECEILREFAASGGPTSPWNASSLASCIFETAPAHICDANPSIRSYPAAYKTYRSTWPLQSTVYSLLFHSDITSLVTSILGSSAVLFNDQFIVKPGVIRDGIGFNTDDIENHRTSFGWHRDRDYCCQAAVRAPSISIWIALDDVTKDNGCMVMRPKSHLDDNDDNNNDDENRMTEAKSKTRPLCTHGGDDVAVPLQAGDAIVTSDAVEHCSYPNKTPYARRAWMPQFSSNPIVWESNPGVPVSLAIPLKNDESLDTLPL